MGGERHSSTAPKVELVTSSELAFPIAGLEGQRGVAHRHEPPHGPHNHPPTSMLTEALLSVRTAHSGVPCRSVERSLIHHSRVPINPAPGPQHWGMYSQPQQCHPLIPPKHVPACKDQPTWLPRGKTGRFKGSPPMSTCIGVGGPGLRSVLVHIQRRRVGDAKCVKVVGSGDSSNATVTPASLCSVPSSMSTMASGESTSSLTCIFRHNFGGIDQDQRFAHDIERKVIGRMQFSRRLLQSSYRLGK